MTAVKHGRIVYLARAIVPTALALLAAALLLVFPPTRYGFYPRCPINQYFHVLCPGCGSTRALVALLHGSFAEAFRINALTTLLGPIALVYAGICYWRVLSGKRAGWPQPPATAVYSTLAVAAIFTIARNL